MAAEWRLDKPTGMLTWVVECQTQRRKVKRCITYWLRHELFKIGSCRVGTSFETFTHKHCNQHIIMSRTRRFGCLQHLDSCDTVLVTFTKILLIPHLILISVLLHEC